MAKEKEEKEQKPKKAFEAKIVVWEDGEMDVEMYEYRQNPSGRGAPGKWRLKANDFVRRIEETLGDPKLLLDTSYDAMGGLCLDSQELKDIVGEAVNNNKKKANTPAVEKVEDEEPPATPPDSNDMDFGGFDKPKEK